MKRKFIVFLLVILIFGVGWFLLSRPNPNAKITFNFPKNLQSSEELTVPLRVSTGMAANAAEFYFSFPPDLLEVKEIDKSGSFYALWVKDSPSYDNEKGQIYIAGGLPTPGFTGKDGLVATVKFKTKTTGSGTITLDLSKSRILANDGLGTKIPATFKQIQFIIK